MIGPKSLWNIQLEPGLCKWNENGCGFKVFDYRLNFIFGNWKDNVASDGDNKGDGGMCF
jgi:hypothetical protein